MAAPIPSEADLVRGEVAMKMTIPEMSSCSDIPDHWLTAAAPAIMLDMLLRMAAIACHLQRQGHSTRDWKNIRWRSESSSDDFPGIVAIKQKILKFEEGMKKEQEKVEQQGPKMVPQMTAVERASEPKTFPMTWKERARAANEKTLQKLAEQMTEDIQASAQHYKARVEGLEEEVRALEAEQANRDTQHRSTIEQLKGELKDTVFWNKWIMKGYNEKRARIKDLDSQLSDKHEIDYKCTVQADKIKQLEARLTMLMPLEADIKAQCTKIAALEAQLVAEKKISARCASQEEEIRQLKDKLAEMTQTPSSSAPSTPRTETRTVDSRLAALEHDMAALKAAPSATRVEVIRCLSSVLSLLDAYKRWSVTSTSFLLQVWHGCRCSQ